MDNFLIGDLENEKAMFTRGDNCCSGMRNQLAHAQQVTSIAGQIRQTSNGWGGEGIYLYMNNANQPIPCGSRWAVMQSTRPDHKVMVSQLLLAFAIKADVTVYVVEPCYNGSANVVGIELR
jgi:hypothetical protein